jgi:hypothetical protein
LKVSRNDGKFCENPFQPEVLFKNSSDVDDLLKNSCDVVNTFACSIERVFSAKAESVKGKIGDLKVVNTCEPLNF